MHQASRFHRNSVRQFAVSQSILLTLLIIVSSAVIAREPGPDYAYGGYNDRDPFDGMQGGWWFNLGPTGVRAKPEFKEPRTLTVMFVFPNSPAAGKVKVGDKVVGVNGKIFQVADHFIFRGPDGKHPFGAKHYFGFDDGPRLDIGMAVEESEGNPSLKGMLTFMIIRDGKKLDVPVQLKQIGYFSKNFPYDCPKSKLLREEAAAWVAKNFNTRAWSGDAVAKSAGLLALMSQGNTYMPMVKNWMRGQAGGSGGAGWTWVAPLMTIPTAEYYLATGDEALLPLLKRQEKTLGNLQGPNGAYMHKSHKPGGYSEMAFPAGLCGTAWALLKQCDINVDSNKYAKTRLLLTCSTAGWGGIGYGTMWTGYQPLKIDMNGLTIDPNGARSTAGVFDGGSRLAGGAMGAIMMHYLDPMDKLSENYVKRGIRHAFNSRRACTSGHLTGYFTTEWVMIVAGLGTVMDDMPTYRAFMDHWKYWLNAARCYDGGWYFEPTSDNQLAGWHGPRQTITCAAIMMLSVPLHNLAILGRDPLIPGIDKTSLSPPALTTYEMIKKKRGQASTQIASISKLKKTATGDEATALDLMSAYVMKPVLRKIDELESLSRSKDMYQLQEQLTAFDPKYKGVDTYDSRTAVLRTGLITPESKKLLDTGKLYYTKLVPLYDESAATVSFDKKKTTRSISGLGGPEDSRQLGSAEERGTEPANVPVYEISRAMKRGQVLKSTKDFVTNYPDAPYSQMARELSQEYLIELATITGEIASLQESGDVYQSTTKLLDADSEYSAYSNYLDKVASVRQALTTPESKKLYQVGAAYYKMLETASASGARSPKKGQILQAAKTFTDLNNSNPYGRMASQYSQSLLVELDVIVNEITSLHNSGDPLMAIKKIELADKEYAASSEYVAKLAPIKTALSTPESKKLVEIGTAYYKLVDATKPDAKVAMRKGLIIQSFSDFIANYGKTSYGTLAGPHQLVMLTQLDTVISNIVSVLNVGDPYMTHQKIEEVNKEYGMCKAYVEKLAPIREELNTPANKKLLQAGTSYYRLVDDIKGKPGGMSMGGGSKKAAASSDSTKQRLELYARQFPNTIYATMAREMAATYK